MSSRDTNNSSFGEGNRGLQVGANCGSISVTLQPSRPESPAHVGSAAIPFRQNDNFVPRGDLLDRIDELCSRPAGRGALMGFGGVGKSHLAIEYAYRVKERSDKPNDEDPRWVFWVHAANKERIEEGFRDIAKAVKLPGRDNLDVNIFSLVHDWLKQETKGKWLMVLDSADDVGVFTTLTDGPTSPALLSCIPWSRNGSVLVTTRYRNVATKLGCRQHDIINVGMMSEYQGLQLLRHGIGSQEDDEPMRQLFHALGGIPLALSQAGAYIQHRSPRMSISKYLERLQSDRKMIALLEEVEDDPWRYSDPETSHSVLLTLHVSFEQINKERPSAAALLGVMSFLDGQLIADSILRAWRAMPRTRNKALSRYVSHNTPPVEPDSSSCESIDDAFDKDVTLLLDYSLITATAADTFGMHRLVQYSTRRWCRHQGSLEQAKHSSIVCIHHAATTPGIIDPSEKSSWRRLLLPHLSTVARHPPATHLLSMSQSEQVPAENPAVLWLGLMSGAAIVLSRQADFGLRLQCSKVLFEYCKKAAGWDNRNTLLAAHDLAAAAIDMADVDKAEDVMAQAIEGRQRRLSSENPLDILSALTVLGDIRLLRNQLDAAIETSNAALEMSRFIHGEYHFTTMFHTGRLAYVLNKHGQRQDAMNVMRDLLGRLQTELGDQSEQTIGGALIMAIHYFSEEPEEFEKIVAMYLPHSQQALGDQHLFTEWYKMLSSLRLPRGSD